MGSMRSRVSERDCALRDYVFFFFFIFFFFFFNCLDGYWIGLDFGFSSGPCLTLLVFLPSSSYCVFVTVVGYVS